MRRSPLALLAALLLVPGVVSAGTLVTPPLYLPNMNFLATCNATNKHRKDVEVTLELVDSNGNTEDSITTIVPPGATKSWSLAGPAIVGCRISFKGSDKRIVGTLYLLEPLNPLPVHLVVEAR